MEEDLLLEEHANVELARAHTTCNEHNLDTQGFCYTGAALQRAITAVCLTTLHACATLYLLSHLVEATVVQRLRLSAKT